MDKEIQEATGASHLEAIAKLGSWVDGKLAKLVLTGEAIALGVVDLVAAKSKEAERTGTMPKKRLTPEAKKELESKLAGVYLEMLSRRGGWWWKYVKSKEVRAG